MFKLVIDSESLKNPLILNRFNNKKVIIEYEPHSSSKKYHHVFFIDLPEREFPKTVENIKQFMKSGWYSFGWNGDYIYIIFNEKVFKVQKKYYWEDREYKKAVEFGLKSGIQKEFTDYKKYLNKYLMIK